MTDERIDIEVQDKISTGPATKLRAIAAAALEADANIRKMVSAMGRIDTSAFDKMANASAKVTRAAAQQTAADARLTTANARLAVSNDKAAIAAQKLATETARAQAANSKAATAASQAATAANNQAKSALALAAAQQRAAAAGNAANNAQNAQNRGFAAATRSTRQQRAALVNLSYQLQDIFVGLASGQKPMTVFIQQGFQIQGIAQGMGVGLRGLGAMFLKLIPPQVLAALAIAASGMALLTSEVRKSTGVAVSFGDTFKAVFQVAWRELTNFIKSIPGVSKAFSVLYDALVVIGKQLVTVITAPFSFAYNEIVTIFSHLAPALGEVFVGGLNVIVIAFEKALNLIIKGVNGYVDMLNVISKKLGGMGDIKVVDEVYLGRIQTDFKNLSALAVETGTNLSHAMDANRLNKFYDEIAKQAVKNKLARDKEKAGHKETFDDIVQEYLVQINGLRHVGLERERILAIGKAEDKLNRQLTDSEKQRLSGLVDTLQMLEMVNELNQPLINLQGQLPLLDSAFENGLISVDQYRQKVLELRLEAEKLDRSFDGGLRQGLIQVEQQFGDVASVVSDGIVNAFRSAEDAMTSFVATGKLDFKGFVDSLISDLARLYVRMNIIAPLARSLGFGGKAAAASSSGGGFDVLGAIGSLLPSFDVGTSRVPRDMIANIHKDEIIVPASASRAIRAGKASLGASGGGNNITFAPVIQLTMQGGGSQAQQQNQAQSAAKMINDEIEKRFLEMSRRESKQGGMFNRSNVVA